MRQSIEGKKSFFAIQYSSGNNKEADVFSQVSVKERIKFFSKKVER